MVPLKAVKTQRVVLVVSIYAVAGCMAGPFFFLVASLGVSFYWLETGWKYSGGLEIWLEMNFL